MVALVIPGLLLRPSVARFHLAGLLPLGAGAIVLLICVRDFYVAGRGTLAPWAPPERLVVVGPYRFSRNPMYVAVILMLSGWALAFRSRGLITYAAVMAVVFHLRVRFWEEPWLAETHGEEWLRYRSAVPRWLGFSRPAEPAGVQPSRSGDHLRNP
jgi:protein-S-isoprenylcysteine O-methyltransferase Ste14